MKIEILIPEKHLTILKLTREGLTSKQVAEQIQESRANVDRIKQALLVNFDCKNTTQLIGLMVEKGVI